MVGENIIYLIWCNIYVCAKNGCKLELVGYLCFSMYGRFELAVFRCGTKFRGGIILEDNA